jgi:hypothetical protein
MNIEALNGSTIFVECCLCVRHLSRQILPIINLIPLFHGATICKVVDTVIKEGEVRE